MSISIINSAHRIYYYAKKVGTKYAKQMRATLGERFKILLIDAGLTPEQAGKDLHVTARTIRYWTTGKVVVSYSPSRLIRILQVGHVKPVAMVVTSLSCLRGSQILCETAGK
jgi:hypothetical protein